ncbi:MAG TPA: glycerophosphodiester phosphodiesterase family protein [Pyrinomonadaceae bacterium]|nr:glycerophosphodiester phosphodiesterase family protein [Pyrinomonadaceae bacterium]
MSNNLPLIIGHRGASAIAPENTMTAFRLALAVGADGIECDVRLARDNVPVVFHDATLLRTGLREGKLSDYTSRELARMDVGSWFNLKFPKKAQNVYSRESVPTLAKLFELMRDNEKLIYVELKCKNENPRNLAESVAAIIRKFDLQHRVIIKSFEHDAVREIKRLLPEIRTAALFSPRPMRVLRPTHLLIKSALGLEADELSLHYSLATEPAVRKAAASQLKTVIWTANHSAWVKRALKLGVYGIITNNPGRLIARRKKLLAETNF